jgi:hypothetical protein
MTLAVEFRKKGEFGGKKEVDYRKKTIGFKILCLHILGACLNIIFGMKTLGRNFICNAMFMIFPIQCSINLRNFCVSLFSP